MANIFDASNSGRSQRMSTCIGFSRTSCRTWWIFPSAIRYPPVIRTTRSEMRSTSSRMWLEISTMHSLAAQLFEQRDRFSPRHRIESVQRLIKHQHAWVMGDGLSEANLLPHALAVAGDLSRGRIAKLHALDSLHWQDRRPSLLPSRGASGCREQTAIRSCPRGKESNCVQ